ncbi:hypothetical protein LSCM1_08201 [Leishmania martiniquensis]|uniref:Uncharacterized protein n=1 Tax=Leishmania martiniquensis TaxID=1580590 RepID=A0A836KUZ4_9TRYP|nr:hypothetical protein LSCM1_08201 [Leishmania martiniquensis]
MEEARCPKTDTGTAAGLRTSAAAATGVSSGTKGATAMPTRREPCGSTLSFALPEVLPAAAAEGDGINTSGSSAPPPPLTLDMQRRDLKTNPSPGRTTATASGTPADAVGVQKQSSSPYLSGPSLYASTPSLSRNGSAGVCGLLDTSRAHLAAAQRTCGTTAAAGSGRLHEYNLSVSPSTSTQRAAVTPCWTSSLHDMLASSPATAAAASATRVAAHSPSNAPRAGADNDAQGQHSASRVAPAQQALREALVHVLQRERVRALLTRAWGLWRLLQALRLNERRHDSRDDLAGKAEREGLSPTLSAGQQHPGGQPPVSTAARHTFSRHRYVDAAVHTRSNVLAHPHPLTTDSPFSSAHQWKSPVDPEGTLSGAFEPKEATSASASLPTWTPLGGVGTGVPCCGIITTAGVDDDDDGLRDLDDGVEVSQQTELRQRQQRSRGGSAMDAALAATSIVPSLTAMSNASAKQSLSWPSQSLVQLPVLEEVLSASFAQTPTTASVPALGTTDSIETSLSAGAALLAETMAGQSGSKSNAATATAAAVGIERKKSVVQHVLAGKSPQKVSPHRGPTNFLGGGVAGSGAALSFEGSPSRPQSSMEAPVVIRGPLLRPHRPRSGGGGGGVGLMASDSEDHSSSSLMCTSQGRQAGGVSGVWGSPRDCDSARSRSMTPLPMSLFTVTTASQLLAREAEDRVAVQTREEQRRLRLQRDMSAVMDQLMMAALRRRSSERGLHPSLRASAVASPVPQESDDSSDESCIDDERGGDNAARCINFLCEGAVEARRGSATSGSAEVVASWGSAPRISAASPPPVQLVATSRSEQRSLSPYAEVKGAQPYCQRSRRTEGEGRQCDETEERARGSRSHEDEEAIDVSTALSEPSVRALRSTLQWGANVLDAITITTDAEVSTDQVMSTAATPRAVSPRRPSSRLSRESHPDGKREGDGALRRTRRL